MTDHSVSSFRNRSLCSYLANLMHYAILSLNRHFIGLEMFKNRKTCSNPKIFFFFEKNIKTTKNH